MIPPLSTRTAIWMPVMHADIPDATRLVHIAHPEPDLQYLWHPETGRVYMCQLGYGRLWFHLTTET